MNDSWNLNSADWKWRICPQSETNELHQGTLSGRLRPQAKFSVADIKIPGSLRIGTAAIYFGRCVKKCTP
jgi:hypothetical protein